MKRTLRTALLTAAFALPVAAHAEAQQTMDPSVQPGTPEPIAEPMGTNQMGAPERNYYNDSEANRARIAKRRT